MSDDYDPEEDDIPELDNTKPNANIKPFSDIKQKSLKIVDIGESSNIQKLTNSDDDSYGSSESEESDNVDYPIGTVPGVLLADYDSSSDEEGPIVSGTFEWKQSYNPIKESQEITSATINWGVIVYVIYVVIYEYFLYAVLFQIPWKRGLYGGSLPHESSYVADHFNIVWCFTVLTLCNIFVPATLLWILSNLGSYFRRDIGLSVVVFQTFVSLFVLLSMCVTLLGYCNTGVFRNPTCDDSNTTAYCTKWADDNPAGCPRDTPADISIQLKVNVLQYRWMVVLLLFVVFNSLVGYTIYKITRLAYFGQLRYDYGRYVENLNIVRKLN